VPPELCPAPGVTTVVIVLLASILIQTEVETISVTVDGQERTALLFRPARASAHPPVVFAFHGHGGNPRQASRSFDIQGAWPDAAVVYPQGLPTRSAIIDPQGRFPGWDVGAEDSNKDIRFFDALYAKAMKLVAGNPKRVYAMGHSNGGYFMYTLWAMRPNLFAAFGSAEAGGAGRFNLSPKPIFITIGSQDKIVPPALQKRSLDFVQRVDQSASNGIPYGEKGTLYKGTAPVVVWNYPGTHAFPRDCVPSMIKFFQGLP